MFVEPDIRIGNQAHRFQLDVHLRRKLDCVAPIGQIVDVRYRFLDILIRRELAPLPTLRQVGYCVAHREVRERSEWRSRG